MAHVCLVMQMFVSCVHPVVVLNAAFGMTCSLLMLVEVVTGVSFCLFHPVAVSAFIIYSGVCACTAML